MKEKSWIILCFVMIGLWGMAVISKVNSVEKRISGEIAGFCEQITVLTEKLSMDDSTATYLVPSTDIRYTKAGAALIPVDTNGEGIERNLNFHEIRYDFTINHAIGRSGAFVYVLDSSGRKISDGFHKFFLKDGKLWGQFGASEQLVTIKN